jgi:hypothetical protein
LIINSNILNLCSTCSNSSYNFSSNSTFPVNLLLNAFFNEACAIFINVLFEIPVVYPYFLEVFINRSLISEICLS